MEGISKDYCVTGTFTQMHTEFRFPRTRRTGDGYMKRSLRQSLIDLCPEGLRSRQDSAACVSLPSNFDLSKSNPTTRTRAGLFSRLSRQRWLLPGCPGWEPHSCSRERCPSRAAKHSVPRDRTEITTEPALVSTPILAKTEVFIQPIETARNFLPRKPRLNRR